MVLGQLPPGHLPPGHLPPRHLPPMWGASPPTPHTKNMFYGMGGWGLAPHMGGKCLGGKCPGGKCPGGNCPRTIKKSIVPGASLNIFGVNSKQYVHSMKH